LRFDLQRNAGKIGLSLLRPSANTVQYGSDLSFGHDGTF
jgi:hypothetical protein